MRRTRSMHGVTVSPTCSARSFHRHPAVVLEQFQDAPVELVERTYGLTLRSHLFMLKTRKIQ